jgi:hypothetical protein
MGDFINPGIGHNLSGRNINAITRNIQGKYKRDIVPAADFYFDFHNRQHRVFSVECYPSICVCHLVF